MRRFIKGTATIAAAILFIASPVKYTQAQSVDFTFQTSDGLFCNPSTIQFTQQCTGNPTGLVWTFGNGQNGFTSTASATYTTAGTYAVQLTALYPQTAISITKTITINPAVSISLAANRTYICQPGIINFTANATGSISNYQWDFGDSSPPLVTPSGNTSHSFATFGTFNVVVKTTAQSNCFNVANLLIEVKKPPINVAVTSTSGCIPTNAGFNATVTLPVGGLVNNYVWSFGDASLPVTTTTPFVNHLYTAIGAFAPTVSITTNEGCSNSFTMPNVNYGIPPTDHVAYAKKAVICASENAAFVAKAFNADTYFWDLGDGTTVRVYDTSYAHRYTSLGTKNVTVTPYFNNCPGNAISFQIEVVGIIAAYSYANSCADKKTFAFTNNTLGNLSLSRWNFGDLSPATNIKSPIHTFPAQGQFTTQLFVLDSITGCSDSISAVVYTANPSLVNPDPFICRNTSTRFTIINNYNNPNVIYKWDVLGSNINTGNIPFVNVKGLNFGSFNNFLIADNDYQYCPDTINLNQQITVRGPNLIYSLPISTCLNSVVNIQNNSAAFIPADTVKLWYWNYGNQPKNDTIYQPLPVLYRSPGNYTVKLSAIDKNGCIDSTEKIVSVYPLPFLNVLLKRDTLCLGQSDSIIVFHSDSILWSPSNGLSCNNCDTVLASPIVTTEYIINTENVFNCSLQDTVNITVMQPFVANVALTNRYVCLNDTLILDVDPKSKKVVWSPSAGLSSVNSYSPIASPIISTVYTALLTDSANCFSSTVAINIGVKLLPQVNAGPDQVLPYNAAFTINPVYSNNVSSYIWTPATQLNCTECQVTSGTALVSEHYNIKVTSDSGCIASDSIKIAIDCRDAYILMPKAFSPNNDNLNDYYFPLTRGIKSITRFAVYNRSGQTLFDATNILPNNKLAGWNGFFKGQPQSSGAFVYTIEALCDTGEKISKKGSFLIVK